MDGEGELHLVEHAAGRWHRVHGRAEHRGVRVKVVEPSRENGPRVFQRLGRQDVAHLHYVDRPQLRNTLQIHVVIKLQCSI